MPTVISKARRISHPATEFFPYDSNLPLFRVSDLACTVELTFLMTSFLIIDIAF